MLIESIMTRRIVSARPDDDLKSLKDMFESAGFHHLLVVEGGKLQGIISDRDLLRALSPFVATPAERPIDAATMRKKAHQIMTRAVVTVAPDMTVQSAIALLLEKKITALPVVSAAGILLGIVTWRDLLRACQTNQSL
jgi:acetoin utilization protein AcuB